MQEKQILLDSKNLQALQTILELHTYKDTRVVYVEVEKAKRPSFESVKRAYDEILKVGNAEEVFSYIGGKLNEARIEAKKRKERGEMVNTYDNACATRVSYALNYGGMIINNAILVSGTKWQGKDQYLYYTGVSGIKGLLLENWKQLKPYSQTNNRDFYKIFYDHRKEPYTTLISYGKIINEQRVNKIRKDNLDFFHILCSLNIKGIVTMVIDGWGDAGGHTTLWNINHFLDNQNYLNYGDEIIFVRELCFWSLE